MSLKQGKKFEELQAKWYAKLAKEGFVDIEGGMENRPKIRTQVYRHGMDLSQIEAKAEYYRLAEHFLIEYKFAHPIEKLVWKLHSEGVPLRTIVVLLDDQGIKTDKNAVNNVTKKISKIMLKRYLKRHE